MAGFHLPGDPYYPNQGNGGWIEEDPEEDPEEIEEEAEEEEEAGEPMHLEAKIACLARLCDLLSTPRGTPASSGLHRLVQPLLDGLPNVEKETREHVAQVQSECEAAMKALQKRAPSMVSSRYDAWQEEVGRLAHAAQGAPSRQ